VTFSDTYSAKNQKAALMMSVNKQLNHDPPISWTCYSPEGAEGAGNSNLALGVNGRDAIDLYIQDPGTGNGFVGHRRWIFYPQTQTMGTGDIPASNGFAPANSLWVFDGNYGGPRPVTREEFVAWPPPGYVPYQVTYRRWSFSYPGADFSSAAVTMTLDGVSLPVTLGPLATGYGENTLVWSPEGIDFVEGINRETWPVPAKDTAYRVTINNVIISGVSRNFAYSVTVFDPAAPGLGHAPAGPMMLLLE
ncbi:MAG: CAP domain-containing protein, partial [Deltaproteobacteria bacterium]|nr:CAP domain-containing protein [Deltaproteobacteria bacterium]